MGTAHRRTQVTRYWKHMIHSHYSWQSCSRSLCLPALGDTGHCSWGHGAGPYKPPAAMFPAKGQHPLYVHFCLKTPCSVWVTASLTHTPCSTRAKLANTRTPSARHSQAFFPVCLGPLQTVKSPTKSTNMWKMSQQTDCVYSVS